MNYLLADLTPVRDARARFYSYPRRTIYSADYALYDNFLYEQRRGNEDNRRDREDSRGKGKVRRNFQREERRARVTTVAIA